MTLNYVRRWGSSLGYVEYPFNSFTLKSTLTQYLLLCQIKQLNQLIMIIIIIIIIIINNRNHTGYGQIIWIT